MGGCYCPGSQRQQWQLVYMRSRTDVNKMTTAVSSVQVPPLQHGNTIDFPPWPDCSDEEVLFICCDKALPLNNANVFLPAFTNIWNNETFCKMVELLIFFFLSQSLFVKFTSKSSGSSRCCDHMTCSHIQNNVELFGTSSHMLGPD